MVSIALFGNFLLVSCWVSAALIDLRTMQIPNVISLALAIGYFLIVPFAGNAPEEIAMTLVATLGIFALCFALFASGLMGGGDVKLITTSSLWFGFDAALIMFFIGIAFFGGLLTIAILLLRRATIYFPILIRWIPNSIRTGPSVPYGVAIAASGLFNLEYTLLSQL